MDGPTGNFPRLSGQAAYQSKVLYKLKPFFNRAKLSCGISEFILGKRKEYRVKRFGLNVRNKVYTPDYFSIYFLPGIISRGLTFNGSPQTEFQAFVEFSGIMSGERCANSRVKIKNECNLY